MYVGVGTGGSPGTGVNAPLSASRTTTVGAPPLCRASMMLAAAPLGMAIQWDATVSRFPARPPAPVVNQGQSVMIHPGNCPGASHLVTMTVLDPSGKPIANLEVKLSRTRRTATNLSTVCRVPSDCVRRCPSRKARAGKLGIFLGARQPGGGERQVARPFEYTGTSTVTGRVPTPSTPTGCLVGADGWIIPQASAGTESPSSNQRRQSR